MLNSTISQIGYFIYKYTDGVQLISLKKLQHKNKYYTYLNNNTIMQ